MDRKEPPYSLPLCLPRTGRYPERLYLKIKSGALASPDPKFIDALYPGQIAHAAFILKDPLGLGKWSNTIAQDSVFITDVWLDQRAADRAAATRIDPTLRRLCLSIKPLPNFRLIAAFCNPDLRGFTRYAVSAAVEVWPELNFDSARLHEEIVHRIMPEGGDLPRGLGTYCAYIVGGRIVTVAVWRTPGDHASFRQHLTAEMDDMFEKFGVSGQPKVLHAEVVGIGVRQELHYIASTH